MISKKHPYLELARRYIGQHANIVYCEEPSEYRAILRVAKETELPPGHAHRMEGIGPTPAHAMGALVTTVIQWLEDDLHQIVPDAVVDGPTGGGMDFTATTSRDESGFASVRGGSRRPDVQAASARTIAGTVPRTFSGLMKLGRYQLRLLAEELGLFPAEGNGQERLEFMGKSTRAQARLILQALTK